MSLRFNARTNTLTSDGNPQIIVDGGVVEANVGLTADANSSQGDGVITAFYNVYSTVATTGDAATLQSTFASGTVVYVKNDGANSMDVFPASGDDAGAGDNNAIALAAGESITFIGTAADSTWTGLIVPPSTDGGGISGLGIWKYRTETTAPPASGQIRFNNANISSATEFFLHETNQGGVDVSTFLGLMIQDGSVLYMQDKTNSDNFVIIEISSSTDNGVYRTFGIQSITEQGTEPAQNTDVILITTGVAAAGGGGGDVTKVGTPVNNELGVWTGDGTLEGESELTYFDSELIVEASQAGFIADESDGGGISFFRATSTNTSDSGIQLEFNSTTGTDACLRQVTSSGVAEDVWIGFAEDGGVDLRHNDTPRLLTTASGVDISGDTSTGNVSGSFVNIRSATTELTGLTGATVTASSLIPDGALIVGVTVRVTTTITGATSFDIGDGTDVDRWGVTIGLPSGTTTTGADFTSGTVEILLAAGDVVLTANGPDFSAGAVRIVAYYMDLTAPTA